MRITLDETLPFDVADALRAAGHDVHTVPQESLTGCDDDSILTAAASEGRFLVPQDLDFSDLRRFRPGSHLGIAIVRLRDFPRKELRMIDLCPLIYFLGGIVPPAVHR